MPLVKLCRDRQWHYLLRIAKEQTFRRRLTAQKWSTWTACEVLATKEGQRWFGAVQVWQDDRLETFLSAVWEPGHTEAWFLISDQSAGPIRVAHYAWRMRVESTFQDTKSRGWNLEASLIEDRARLDPLGARALFGYLVGEPRGGILYSSRQAGTL